MLLRIVLLVLALGAVSCLVYWHTAQVVEARKAATQRLVKEQFERRTNREKNRLDHALLYQGRALASLAQKYREVFVLRDVEQLSIEETAETLGISIASVKTRLLRARLMLRDLLAPVLAEGWFSRAPFGKGSKPW